MAKKKKESEENINDENQDINNIDENFGLPDLDYQPVDDIEEENIEEQESSLEEEEMEHESSDEELVQEETNEEPSYSESEEDTSETRDDSNSENTETGYVPGTYAEKMKNNSGSGKTTGIIVVVLLLIVVAAGSYYMFVMRPKQVEAEKAKQEQLAKEEADKRKKEDYTKLIEQGDSEFGAKDWSAAKSSYSQASALYASEQYPIDQLAIINDKLDEIAALNAKPKIGTVETISAATKRFYIVASSSIDGDLAMDFASKIAKKGDNVGIIQPYGKNKYYRVTLGNYDSWGAAENAVNDFNATYGNGIWILKY